ncbi:MAG: guanylate kinase [Eubacterium sp.]|nr:guanylate kinase [Eubacterium sp.]
MSKGVLTVISGFSGAGKGTIMKELIQRYQYFVSISATTRQPRAGEEHGREYYFYDREQFESMIANDQLIEWAEYVGNYYGTPKEAVEKQLNEGKDVLLEIEMQGGMLVKEQFPDAVLIFITPPSAQELKDRLCGRGTETEEQIANRLARASEEVPYMKSYEYLVVNDDLDEAVEHVHQIITTQHAKMKYHELWIEQMETTLAQFHK